MCMDRPVRERRKDRTMRKMSMALLLACVIIFLTACGAAETAALSAENDSQQPAEPVAQADVFEDGQNPVMNFVGIYQCDKASVFVEAAGKEDAKITAAWGSSYKENTEWVMSGPFDTESLRVEYHDCERIDRVYREDGSVESETKVYFNGHGFVFFDYESNTLTWQDDQEHVADGMTFEYCLPDPMASLETENDASDYYSAVTAMEKNAVEEFAAFVRDAYLNEDWEAVRDLIRYPIMIAGTEVADAEAFLRYMSDKTVDESDRHVMEDEVCREMFFNGQGLCMGSGQVWILDPNYMTDEEPQLQIIALSGIVDR